MSLAEDMEAFDRAFVVPAEGEPLVSEEQKKEMLKQSLTCIRDSLKS